MPSKEADNYYYNVDGQLTYTTNRVNGDMINRHSYFYLNMNGGYEFMSGYWLNLLLKTQRLTFSEGLASRGEFFPFIFPMIYFKGSPQELLFIGKGDSLLEFEGGTIVDFTHGYGLYYSQFTGLGIKISYRQEYFSVKMTALGSGYYSGDDIASGYLYTPNEYLGIGILYEREGALGSRIVPGISFKLPKIYRVQVYGEMGTSFVFQPNTSSFLREDLLSFYSDQKAAEIVQGQLYQVRFRDSLSINKSNLAGLIGVDVAWKNKWLRLKTKSELRYYGEENSAYYESQKYLGFDFYSDLNVDRKLNNQPFNFYVYRNDIMAFYLMQEFEVNYYWNFFASLRNELLYLRKLNSDNQRIAGNDIVTLKSFIRLQNKLDLGVSVSNLLISYYESSFIKSQFPNNYRQRRNLFMFEAANSAIVDLYLYYKF